MHTTFLEYPTGSEDLQQLIQTLIDLTFLNVKEAVVTF